MVRPLFGCQEIMCSPGHANGSRGSLEILWRRDSPRIVCPRLFGLSCCYQCLKSQRAYVQEKANHFSKMNPPPPCRISKTQTHNLLINRPHCTFLEVSLAPLAQSSTSNSSLSPLPTKSKLAPDLDSSTHVPPSCAAAATTQTINITTLNITYGGGDSYNGDIRNGCVGGRRNEYYFESRSGMLTHNDVDLALTPPAQTLLLLLLPHLHRCCSQRTARHSRLHSAQQE